MASRNSVTRENLVRLGIDRLAALLLDLADEDATLKRRLRLELLSASSPADVASAVRKRLATIARSRSFVDGPRFRDLVRDLVMQRDVIAERIAPADPAAALDLMWRFMGLAKAIHERCDDSNGIVGEVFRDALDQLGPIAAAAKPDPVSLADQVFDALQDSGCGQYDGLIGLLASTLGRRGLAHLKRRVSDWAATLPRSPARGKPVMTGPSACGPVPADNIQTMYHAMASRRALADIADAEGDPDAFIAQYPPKQRRVPQIAADIAHRLLAAGRASEALAVLDAVETHHSMPEMNRAWQLKRIDALEVLGRGDDAQAFRWQCFEAALDPDHLRAYVQRLPDFDDLEAEERGLDLATRSQAFDIALDFLVDWPALDRAADMVIRRRLEVDGNLYFILTPAAEALAGHHPLAATILLRAMIDFSLGAARSSRYRHAARHLDQCTGLAARIEDWTPLQPHTRYVETLRSDHGRKAGFWRWVDDRDGDEAG